jgi:hypothetical protein
VTLRGYEPWTPKPETREVIRAVADVLDEYEEYLPISLRQIFYRLVADHGYDKTEAAYNRLGNHVARARRAQLLPFDAIQDTQGKPMEVQAWASYESFWDETMESAEHFCLDRMAGQEVRIEVWSEAGMTDLLYRVASAYGISVYNSRGFASVTNSYNLAKRALEADVPTVLLHVGDHDPSGVSIFESLVGDARAFLIQERAEQDDLLGDDGFLSYDLMDESGPTVRPVRVALTEPQIEEYGVETAPPKPAPRRGQVDRKGTDTRTINWVGETAQAEAIPPDLMTRILRGAIEDQIDLDIWRAVLAEERKDRVRLSEHVTRAREDS